MKKYSECNNGKRYLTLLKFYSCNFGHHKPPSHFVWCIEEGRKEVGKERGDERWLQTQDERERGRDGSDLSFHQSTKSK